MRLSPYLLALPLLCGGCEATAALVDPRGDVPAAEAEVFAPEELSLIEETRASLADEPELLAAFEASLVEIRTEHAPPPAEPTPLETLIGLLGGGGVLAGLYGAVPRSRKHLFRAMKKLTRLDLGGAAGALGSMVGLGSGSVHDALQSALLAARRARDAQAMAVIQSTMGSLSPEGRIPYEDTPDRSAESAAAEFAQGAPAADPPA